jgi:hypothetical protein
MLDKVECDICRKLGNFGICDCGLVLCGRCQSKHRCPEEWHDDLVETTSKVMWWLDNNIEEKA